MTGLEFVRPSSADDAAFLDDFVTMSGFGSTDNHGVDRQAATPADGQTRDWFAELLRSNGFTVDMDPIGNVFGLLELVPGAPYILLGSHLDSQPLAGRFDGAYGVLAAAHASLRTREQLAASGAAPTFNLAVVDWFNEEGCRFKPSMMGSGVFTGLLDLEKTLATVDAQGVSVAEALHAINGVGTFTPPPIAAYSEIHIEQGRSMDDANTTIGMVSSTWSARKYEIVVRGEQSHSGATRMKDRRDALLGAAKVIVAVNDLLAHFDDEAVHSSISELYVAPNSPVTVAREVRFLIDIRARESGLLAEAYSHLQAAIARIEAECRVSIDEIGASIWESGPFLESGIELTRSSAELLGYSNDRVLTLAGHDATNMKEIVPTVMLFVPSAADGISHNEREFTSDEDLVAGLNVFTHVVTRLVLGELPESLSILEASAAV
ncbi:M20 family metallo-hydrolase [Cryobacterium sp. CG_9.6]|uniref:M20 family metallo-hydrolase n=1 Tax=Cryobacterium sp. CG_9.6 TaxID=2760710 RepID=UPI00247489C7|nr:M20 family metallo-hydrolase [Cryobacterium sp. CG_9.6]MDH6236731.1 N-carbamoyl-L-amino-acid hydrolase [Cryobacterium sp. CG_9.6]